MKKSFPGLAAILTLTLSLAVARPLKAGSINLIANGGFEQGLNGWTTLNQPGSAFGGFEVYSGDFSPVSHLRVQPPPEGEFAVMEDALGPIAAVLNQGFTVPHGITSATLNFELYLNTEGAPFTKPGAPLDYKAPFPNLQARVDILTQLADPFSVSAGVLQNLYQTKPGDPTVSGYNMLTYNVTALLEAHGGEPLDLRFAAVHNPFFLLMGVDSVSLVVTTVPEPSGLALLALGGIVPVATVLWRRPTSTADRLRRQADTPLLRAGRVLGLVLDQPNALVREGILDLR